MNRLMFSLGLGLLCLAPRAFAWDPLSALNSTFLGRLNRKINRGVDQNSP